MSMKRLEPAALDALLGGTGLPVEGRRLAGKVALVTGAGAGGRLIGVGSATAVLFAAQGATVAIMDMDRTRAETTQALVERAGGASFVVTADLALGAERKRAVAEVEAEQGRIDILVNSAAVAEGPDQIFEADEERWQRLLDVNLTAPVMLARDAARIMPSRGSIINVSSLAAIRGFGAVSYAASKAALLGAGRDLAFSLGRKGIRVNTLVPGLLHAPMAPKAEARDGRRRSTMLGTEGTAWDVAFAALFLASDESGWITASEIRVDGGSSNAGRTPEH